MPQDAFHLGHIARELSLALVGGKINRITQANKDEVTLHIYTKKRSLKLILSTNASFARVLLTEKEKEPAPVAPNFCMLLRKHLLGAEILKIQRYAFERILEITFHCTGDFSECDRVLHAEIMGKYSNLILTENGVIVGALKPSALDGGNSRPILAGVKYVYPTPQEKLSPFDQDALRERFEAFSTLQEGEDGEAWAKFIFENVAGLALPTARELVKRRPRGLALTDFLGLACAETDAAPCVVKTDGAVNDFFAFPVNGGEARDSLVAAADEYYTYKESGRLFAEKKRRLESAARSLEKKLGKKISELSDRLSSAENAEKYRTFGELLTANLYRVERGVAAVEVQNWYEEGCPNVKIPLDVTLSPQKNAQKYFKAYAKAKRAKEIAAPLLAETEKELAYVNGVISSVLLSETEEDLKEIETELIGLGLLRPPKDKVGAKKPPEIPFREFECEDFKILVGRNNLQNDRLLRQAAPNDLWLHTQKYHSSHVLIVTEGRKVPDAVIKRAAELCAHYSEARGGEKIPVDYCERRFVKKPSKAKAGFVVYTDYKTALVEGKI
ncbi:MAG: NFACT family protein [Clostridia bacterium]|nr:NFACT family protein [Clostridia bacterium]